MRAMERVLFAVKCMCVYIVLCHGETFTLTSTELIPQQCGQLMKVGYSDHANLKLQG